MLCDTALLFVFHGDRGIPDGASNQVGGQVGEWVKKVGKKDLSVGQ